MRRTSLSWTTLHVACEDEVMWPCTVLVWEWDSADARNMEPCRRM